MTRSPQAAKPLQFSIRLMLVATAAVAAGIASIRAETTAEAILAIDGLTVLFASAAILGVTQTSGKLRTFWIGTAMLLGPAAFFSVQSASSVWIYIGQGRLGELTGWWEVARQVWPIWCAAPVNGLLAIFLHWLFWPHPPEPRP
jgi:hypothetical protein